MAMDLNRVEYALREALREEAEKIAAKGGDLARREMALLFAGAEVCMAKRMGVVPDAKYDEDDHPIYKKGWHLAEAVRLY